MIKKTFKALIFFMALLFCSYNSADAMKFNDVPDGYWAYAAIDSVGDDMYAEGYPKGSFKPDNFITRAEYATMVVKAIGQADAPVDKMYYFQDIDHTHWAWNYVVRAADLGIFETLDERYFYPDEYVPRSEIITFMVNILKSEDISRKDAYDILQKSYDDYQDIPDWFKLTAGKAQVLGIIAQSPERKRYLDCDRNVTRAEMAVFLYNLKNELNKYLQARIEKETSPTVVEGGVSIGTLYREGDVVTIPIKTIVPIVVSGQISSKTSQAGQMFHARFADDIVDSEHNLIFSKNLILIGKILDTTKGKYFLRNGALLFELSAVNNDNFLTRIMGYTECEATIAEANKLLQVAKTILKGKNYVLKDGQVVYVKLYKPIRVNIVTGEVLD